MDQTLCAWEFPKTELCSNYERTQIQDRWRCQTWDAWPNGGVTSGWSGSSLSVWTASCLKTTQIPKTQFYHEFFYVMFVNWAKHFWVATWFLVTNDRFRASLVIWIATKRKLCISMILTYFVLPKSKDQIHLQDLLIRGLRKAVGGHPWGSWILAASPEAADVRQVWMSPHKISPIHATPSQNQDRLPSRLLQQPNQ